jgi:hypothetical protein
MSTHKDDNTAMVANTTATLPLCEISQREDGIYQFVFHSASRQAVDDMLTNFYPIYAAAPRDLLFRMLIDFRPEGMTPLTHSYHRVRNFLGEFPQRPENRIAFVVNSTLMINVAQSFLNILYRAEETRFFHSETAEQDAIAWLLR